MRESAQYSQRDVRAISIHVCAICQVNRLSIDSFTADLSRCFKNVLESNRKPKSVLVNTWRKRYFLRWHRRDAQHGAGKTNVDGNSRFGERALPLSAVYFLSGPAGGETDTRTPIAHRKKYSRASSTCTDRRVPVASANKRIICSLSRVCTRKNRCGCRCSSVMTSTLFCPRQNQSKERLRSVFHLFLPEARGFQSAPIDKLIERGLNRSRGVATRGEALRRVHFTGALRQTESGPINTAPARAVCAIAVGPGYRSPLWLAAVGRHRCYADSY